MQDTNATQNRGGQREIYIARIIGAQVFDPNGDVVGRVRDVVLILSDKLGSRLVGFVVEVPGKRRVFVPVSRVTSISTDQMIITGMVNMRRFQKREIETLANTEFIDRIISLPDSDGEFKIEDFSIIPAQTRGVNKDWMIGRLFVRKIDRKRSGISALFGRHKGETRFVKFEDVDFLSGSFSELSTDKVLEAIEDMKPADAAEMILDLDENRQKQIIHDLDNETVADVLEEMDEEQQIEIIHSFEVERAADVLEEMEPDDAADLLGKMDRLEAEELLEEMDEDEAEDVRLLMEYDDDTAGGLMTTVPVIVPPDATVAYALAQIRKEELSPSLASLVFICLSPLETPTGKLLGVLYFQQLLRYPPHVQVGSIVDTDFHSVAANDPIDKVARVFATYNSFIVPVLDINQHLLGAITIDDLVDHMLPKDWRGIDD